MLDLYTDQNKKSPEEQWSVDMLRSIHSIPISEDQLSMTVAVSSRQLGRGKDNSKTC